MSLTHQTILVTRPQHQAAPLCELIRQAGGNPLVFPTIQIEPLTHEAIFQNIIHHLSDYDLAIFVSANAVLPVCPLVNWPSKLPIMAIGPGTAKALAQFGLIPAPLPEKFSSEGLMELPALKAIKNKKIILFCGENPKPLLSETLLSRGAEVTVAISYRRLCPMLKDSTRLTLLATAIDAIVTTSPESLHNLIKLLASNRAWLLSIPLVVISQKMVQLATNLGFQAPIILAENATDEAVVQALKTRVE